MSDYKLKNGESVTIRLPKIEDAEDIVYLKENTDRETLFLALEPGEHTITVDGEENIIQEATEDSDSQWFVAQYHGKVVGQCYVGLVQRNLRFRHRAEVGFVILKEYCNLGIGGKLMEECIEWCIQHEVEQMELNVVCENEVALKMYQDFGFIVYGTIPHALKYLDDTYANEYYMVKPL